MISESELAAGIRNRDPDAFDRLVGMYTKPVYYLAHRILSPCCGKEDIEECVSDVFLEVWQKIRRFDADRSSLRSWVLMLCKYRALTYRRRLQGARNESIEELALPSGLDVEKQVLDRETQEALARAVDGLGETDRALFVRRYCFDESIPILMQDFALTRSAVDNRLLRSRKLIKEAMSCE